MRQLRLALLAIGLGFTPTNADVKVATSSEKILPGTYHASGFSTHFDGEGHWETTPGPGGGGRYSIDGDVIAFTTAPATCPDERVRYRLRFDANGFHMQFLGDSCGRSGVDINFVRDAARVAK